MTRLREHMDEARNIKGDIGKVKKIVKRWQKQSEILRQKTGDEIERVIRSIEMSVSDEEFKQFSDTLADILIDDQIDHNLYNDITFMLHR